MQASPPTLSGWSRGRFVLVVAFLFVAQACLLMLLGDRPHPLALAAAPSRTEIRLLDAPLDDEKLTKHIFAVDPTAFPSTSPHGFAAQAWRLLPAHSNTVAALQEPPPAFLEFTNSPHPARGPAVPAPLHTLFQLTGRAGPQAESTPGLPAVEASRPDSIFLLEGPLASRLRSAPAPLPAWTNSLLSNSVVQFAVNRSGKVISAVLLAGSGMKEADDSALATVKLLCFRPTPAPAPEFEWGTAVFYWKSIAPRARGSE